MKENSRGRNEFDILKWKALISSQQAWLFTLSTRQEMFVGADEWGINPTGSHLYCVLSAQRVRDNSWQGPYCLIHLNQPEASQKDMGITLRGAQACMAINTSDKSLKEHSSCLKFQSSLVEALLVALLFMLRLWVHSETSIHLINHCCHSHLKEKDLYVVIMKLDQWAVVAQWLKLWFTG